MQAAVSGDGQEGPVARHQVRRAFVTGCSSGIGLSVAARLSRRGVQVFGTVRDEPSGARLRAACAGAPVPVDPVNLDLRDRDEIKRGLAEIERTYGAIDLLVNNAGVVARGALENLTETALTEVLETNFVSAMVCMWAVLPAMREQRSGWIVNMSSVAGSIPIPFNSIYSASKHALEALTEAVALEVAPFGVRAAIIQPGHVRTRISTSALSRSYLARDSPYGDRESKAVHGAADATAAGCSPDDVADLLMRVIESDGSRLRWPVGADAVELLEARHRLGEPEWAAYSAERFG